MMLQGKRILLGVGGGIAVYRAVELMRLLLKQGAEVRCVMTKSAQEFVAPLTFEALSGQKVHHELFDLTEEHGMGHIQLVRWADVVVLAPVTANLLAKLAYGIADDLLTTLMVACERPVVLAPAMNVTMWQDSAVQKNVRTLKERGMHIVEPQSGELACGEQGPGRLAEPEIIMQQLYPLLAEQTLSGQRWVINAGPTVESWDAVRTLSNRATGTLGGYMADMAAILGADVTLVAGPGTPKTNMPVARIDVESAAQMLKACEQAAKGADVFVASAAVSDFCFASPSKDKLKRAGQETMQVDLLMNPDIVAHIASLKQRPEKVVAFAAEKTAHVEQARLKLERKGVDAIIANDVSNMGSAEASGWWITKAVECRVEAMTKWDFSRVLVQYIANLSKASGEAE